MFPLSPVTIAANPDGASSPDFGTYEDGGYGLVVRLSCSLAVLGCSLAVLGFNRAWCQLKGVVLVI